MLKNKLPLLPALICALALGVLAAPAPALASHNQAVYFEAPNGLLNPSTRVKTFTQMQSLGVKALRVELSWYEVAPSPTSATKPSFEATNPESYNWSVYDPVLAEAQKLGWPVLLTVTSPVPRWATSNHKAPYITSPNAQDFEQFMTAVARHYGSEVSTYAIWNEPNEPVFLLPQFSSNGSAASPRIYRGLYQAGYAGLKAAGIAHPRVLMGETAPFGYDTVKVRREGTNHAVAPLAFLRGMLCLNAKYKKSGSCGELQATGYAHHAYTLPAGPYYKPSGRGEADDVTIGALSRLTGALNKAANAHAIPAGLPIYLTEFGVQTNPPNKQLGVSFAKQAEFDAIDERIAWSNPRVAAFSQYLLKDDPLSGSGTLGVVGFQTGLETVAGVHKPLYSAWPVPLTVTKQGHGFSLWGLVRPANGATTLTVLVKVKGAKKYRTLKTVHTNSLGYWSLQSSTKGVDWRVRWTSPSGVKYEGPPIPAYAGA